MFNSVSTVAAQVSVGLFAFLISAVCIVSATGPIHLVG